MSEFEPNEKKNFADYLPNYYEEHNPYMYRVGFARRLAAYIIDYLILSLLIVIALFASGQMNELLDGIKYFGKSLDDELIRKTALAIVPIVNVITLLYFTSELFFGASLGKLMLGIRIGSDDLTPAPFTKLLARYIMKNISIVLSSIGMLIPLLALDFFGDFLQILIYIGFFFSIGYRKQAFHDRLSATAVYYNNVFYENNEQKIG